jgi:photosystem II stability/assembly factor-like uncharacterized protein
MEKLTRIFLVFGILPANILLCQAQCTIEAGKNQTIVCGGSAKLNTNAKLVRTYSDTAHFFNSVFFANNDTGYAIGTKFAYTSYDGIILKTTDGGDSWTVLTDTFTNAVNSIFFTDAITGYAVGSLGVIRKTTNGGTNWDSNSFGVYDYFYSVFFTSRNTGFVAGDNGKILRTTNAGTSWDEVNSDTTTVINSIFFPDNNTGYAVGYDPYSYVSYFLKSTNAGASWTRMNDTLHYELQSAYFTSADTGFIAGIERFPYNYNLASDILKTTDGGKSWKVVGIFSGVVLSSVRFLDGSNGYAVGSKGSIIKTSDGGDTWVAIGTNTANSFSSLCFPDSNTAIFLGQQTGIDKMSIPVSYSWYPAVGMDDSTLAEPTVSPVMNTTYIVKTKFKSNCVATDSIKIIVSPLIVYANDIAISCGNTANLSISTNYTGTEALTYAWSPAGNLSDSSVSNPIASVINPTVFSVEITTSNGCMASKDINISTNAVNIQPSICMVTVGDNNKNMIVWEKPASNSIDSFLIYRESMNQTGVYNLIGSLPYSAHSVFIDTSSNALVQSNRYKIAIRDVCENITALSPEHKTMHLNINQAQGSSWNLIWEEYEGFAVSSYRIYRGTSISDLQLTGSTAGGNSSYSDFSAPAGDIFYQVEVIPPNDCSNVKSSELTSSRSNIASNTVLNIAGQTVNSTNFIAFPVPAKNELFFSKPLALDAITSITTLDGKLIMNCTMNNSQNSISVQTLPRGMYILKVMDNRNLYVTKFIKE